MIQSNDDEIEMPEVGQTVTAKYNDSAQTDSEESADLGDVKRDREWISMRGKAIQKYIVGDAWQKFLQITERLSVKKGDGGFDPTKMLLFVKSKVEKEDQLDMDLANLLQICVKNGILPKISNVIPPELQQRYFNVEEVVKDEEVLTFPRLAMSFPYEVAVERSRQLSNASSQRFCIPAKIDDLPYVLAFPYAGLIIPTKGWDKTAKVWERWYFNFLKKEIGFPLPVALYGRVIDQIKAMRALAAVDNAEKIEMMTRLGLDPNSVET